MKRLQITLTETWYYDLEVGDSYIRQGTHIGGGLSENICVRNSNRETMANLLVYRVETTVVDDGKEEPTI